MGGEEWTVPFVNKGLGTQKDPKSFLVSLPILASLIKWLAGLIKLTEEEQEEAGIYLDRPGRANKYRQAPIACKDKYIKLADRRISGHY